MEKRTKYPVFLMKKRTNILQSNFTGDRIALRCIYMLKRKAEKDIVNFLNSTDKKALLISGARQVGKTFLIRELGKRHYKSFVEINFLENKTAGSAFENATDTKSLLFSLSAIAKTELIPNQTLIFLDEVQECKEIVTAIKFLVEDGRYKFILSGSLLGVDLRDIKSVPVGYMDYLDMYPLDFEEFCIANGVSESIIENLRECFETKSPVNETIHSQMLELFKLYLVVGGMPAVVNRYLATNNLADVIREQNSIVQAYKRDISKYDPENKLYIEEIFDLIPSELNAKNKRFIMKKLNDNFKFSRYENSFLWLKDAGVALPTYCVDEPRSPLALSKTKNLFKLFMSDVGLLASMYMNDLQVKILSGELSVNFGSVYENAAAQELTAHGFPLYYFNNKKQGEVDFLTEINGEVVPMEIKSGKDYTVHSALNNILSNSEYNINKAYVFSTANLSTDGKIVYAPIYMLMFIKKHEPKDMIYRPNISRLLANK